MTAVKCSRANLVLLLLNLAGRRPFPYAKRNKMRERFFFPADGISRLERASYAFDPIMNDFTFTT